MLQMAFSEISRLDGTKGFFRGAGALLCREVPFYVAGMVRSSLPFPCVATCELSTGLVVRGVPPIRPQSSTSAFGCYTDLTSGCLNKAGPLCNV